MESSSALTASLSDGAGFTTNSLASLKFARILHGRSLRVDGSGCSPAFNRLTERSHQNNDLPGQVTFNVLLIARYTRVQRMAVTAKREVIETVGEKKYD